MHTRAVVAQVNALREGKGRGVAHLYEEDGKESGGKTDGKTKGT